MPKLKDRVPHYRLHKHSGQAIVTLSGVDHYLGPHGTDVSKAEYDRVVAEWLARSRRPLQWDSHPTTVASSGQIILAFWEHAQGYYRRPDGTKPFAAFAGKQPMSSKRDCVRRGGNVS